VIQPRFGGTGAAFQEWLQKVQILDQRRKLQSRQTNENWFLANLAMNAACGLCPI
jgi:hypothetical protein